MAKARKSVECRYCGESFESAPRRSFAGFLWFKCPKCKRKIIEQLSKGYTISYWIWGVVVWWYFIRSNGLRILAAIFQGNDRIKNTASFVMIAVIPFLLFPVYALLQDQMVRRNINYKILLIVFLAIAIIFMSILIFNFSFSRPSQQSPFIYTTF